MTLLPDCKTLETERLVLRRIDRSDFDFFSRIHQDPDVARYIGAGNPRPREETERWFEDIQESYDRASLGQLAVARKSDGQPLGRSGLSDAAIEVEQPANRLGRGWFFSSHVPDGVDVELLPELGYTFGKEHWGQGYATEAARAVFQYARKSRAFPQIMSVIHADNAGSRAIVRKFGVSYVDVLELSGRPFERYHWPTTARL